MRPEGTSPYYGAPWAHCPCPSAVVPGRAAEIYPCLSGLCGRKCMHQTGWPAPVSARPADSNNGVPIMIQCSCPQCGDRYRIAEELGDEPVVCSQCQTHFMPKDALLARRRPGPNYHDDDAVPEHKSCPYCSEKILATARKCKHCGEILDRYLQRSRTRRVQQVSLNFIPWVLGLVFGVILLIIGIIVLPGGAPGGTSLFGIILIITGLVCCISAGIGASLHRR
jgi:predicted nucleic acid-binding Zn ribbon protein